MTGSMSLIPDLVCCIPQGVAKKLKKHHCHLSQIRKQIVIVKESLIPSACFRGVGGAVVVGEFLKFSCYITFLHFNFSLSTVSL